MIKGVNKSQKLVEAECEMIRSLLKPWPNKKKIIEGPSETTNQIYNGQQADVLSTEEQQALSQAEQILSKARKALGTTINLKDPIKTSEQDTVSNKDVQADQKVKTFSEPLQKTQQKNHITHKNDRPEENTSFVNSSCGQLKQEKPIHSATSKKPATSAEVLLKKESQRRSRPLSQGSNLNSKHQVVNKGYIAAHLLAPFKTDPNIKVPKHSKYKPLSKEIQTSKSASKKTIQSSKVLPSIAQSKISSQDSESKRLAPNANNNASSGSIDFESSEVIEKRNLLLPSNKSVSEPVANSIVQESQSNVIQSQEDSLQSRVAFTLQENGTSLKLPSKLNQLVRKNQKLREKFSVAKIYRKVTENDAAEQFINKLEEVTEVGQELWTRVCALTCLKSHKILMDTLNSLHLEQIEDSSPQYTMYRAKRTLEFVLSAFAELQNEADFFCKANFKNTSNSNHNVKQKHEHDLDVSWLDTGQEALGRNYALQCYLNTDDQWTDLKFIENYIQVQILMTELVLTEWSQALISNKLDQSFVQALYGLMTASGQCLPAFVKNE